MTNATNDLEQALYDSTTDSLPSKKGTIEKNENRFNAFSVALSFREHRANLGYSYIAFEDDLFEYTGTHWREISGQAEKLLFQEIANFAKYPKESHQKEVFSQFKLHTPQANIGKDQSIFMPKYDAANFLNKTLWLRQSESGEIYTEIKDHNKEDYITNVIYQNIEDGEKLPTPMFDAWLDQIASNHPEPEEFKKSLQQVAGAMLLPKYPIVAFLIGPPGSGKSTFIKLFTSLFNGYNDASTIQPCDMFKFNLHEMVNRRINFHTDLNETKPVRDDTLKSIFDQVPMTIERKGLKAIKGLLPAVHVYACNKLPPSLSQTDGVYARRAVFLHFNTQIKEEDQIMDFQARVIKSEASGIIQWALEGIKSVARNGGKYLKIESSKKAVQEWEVNTDPMPVFARGLKEGVKFIDEFDQLRVLKAVQDNRERVKESVVFRAFKHLYEKLEYNKNELPSRPELMKFLVARGFKPYTKYHRMLCNLTISEVENNIPEQSEDEGEEGV